ncbi:lantibiotic dehydratase family protein [Nonlabens xiamenensis]|uniref:lantibiotic dehydratase family protein n=1 Tax=Nonlabens xiamenensis TaxID=2341043 RepID=UPI0029392F16|nr:lantibiotic dehydratase family protein [Nonlabens xiamenensis]
MLDRLMDGQELDKADWNKLLQDELFQQSIYVSSPFLYKRMQAWKNSDLSTDQVQRLQHTLLKYFTRISSRCTPFGLFAGCSSGEFAENTHIIIGPPSSHQKHTRLDFSLMANMIQQLSQNPALVEQLRYTPNDSLYKVYDHYRYVEHMAENEARSYSLEGIKCSEALGLVIEKSKKGISLSNLTQILTGENYDKNDVAAFIQQLQDHQLLIPDIALGTIGADALSQIINKYHDNEIVQETLLPLWRKIEKINQSNSEVINLFQCVEGKIKKMGLDHQGRSIFHTELEVKTNSNQLADSFKKELIEVFNYLSRTTVRTKNNVLDQFKKEFLERYGTKEVQLGLVLDTESGIGYGEHIRDSQGFLDELRGADFSQNSAIRVKWSKLDMMMQLKLHLALGRNDYEIQLSSKDFEQFPEQDLPLPDTFSSMIELYDSALFLRGFSGTSAVNLLGRFAQKNKGLLEQVEKISLMEQQMNPDAILAEINHLPHLKAGNILQRPTFRSFEIPYLSQSHLPANHQLNISDLMISLKENRLVLRSKKWNKVVLPRLGNAHNYQGSTLPLYRFLCDLQSQKEQDYVGFSWNNIYHSADFLPRVRFKNIILAKATWTIKTADFKTLMESADILTAVLAWRIEKKIPLYVQLIEGDNQLLVKMTHIDGLQMLLDAVKTKKSFHIQEYLFYDKGSPIKDAQGNTYANEFIFSLYNQERLTKFSQNIPSISDTLPVSESIGAVQVFKQNSQQ